MNIGRRAAQRLNAMTVARLKRLGRYPDGLVHRRRESRQDVHLQSTLERGKPGTAHPITHSMGLCGAPRSRRAAFRPCVNLPQPASGTTTQCGNGGIARPHKRSGAGRRRQLNLIPVIQRCRCRWISGLANA
jgi:hypothetical protein